jgi:hypothetical protein
MSPALLYDLFSGNKLFWWIGDGLERHFHKLAAHCLPLSEVTRTVEILAVSFFADRKATITGVGTGVIWFTLESIAFKLLSTSTVSQPVFQKKGMGHTSLIGEILRVRRACFLDPILEEVQNALIRKVIMYAAKQLFSFAQRQFPRGGRWRGLEFRPQSEAIVLFGLEITGKKIAILLSTFIFIFNHHQCRSFLWMRVAFPGSLHYAINGESKGLLAPIIAHIVHNTCCELTAI